MTTNDKKDQIWEPYKILIDTRNMEISLFWERSNYFLVLNTGLAIGFFNVKEFPYRISMAIFGVLASFLWLRVSLGAKHWQARWEQRLRDFETEHLPELQFFSADKDRIKKDVGNGLKFFEPSSWLKRVGYLPKHLFYRWASRKPSVSFAMILLAAMFTTGWTVLVYFSVHLRNTNVDCGYY